MKVTFDTDAVITKTSELGVKAYDKAVEVTPDVKEAIDEAKAKAKSFLNRVREAAEKGKEAARK